MIINNKRFKKRTFQILAVFLVITAIVLWTRPDDAMLGFWGGIIGGVAGGLFTYFGVRQTLNFELRTREKDGLPQKILYIDECIHKAERLELDLRIFKENLFNNPASPKELISEIYDKTGVIYRAEKEIKQLVVYVNGKSFREVGRLFMNATEKVSLSTNYIEYYLDKSKVTQSIKGIERMDKKIRYSMVGVEEQYEELKEIEKIEALTFDWSKAMIEKNFGEASEYLYAYIHFLYNLQGEYQRKLE